MSAFRIGITLDTLREDGTSIFDPLALEIGERELSLMKPTAYLINTARGPIVEERALHAALAARHIAGAALDVFEQEPIGAAHPFVGLDNVILTPHSICWTDEFFRNNAESAFRSVVAVARGETPTFVANRDVLKRTPAP